MMNNEQLRGEGKKDTMKFAMVTKAGILKVSDALVILLKLSTGKCTL